MSQCRNVAILICNLSPCETAWGQQCAIPARSKHHVSAHVIDESFSCNAQALAGNSRSKRACRAGEKKGLYREKSVDDLDDEVRAGIASKVSCIALYPEGVHQTTSLHAGISVSEVWGQDSGGQKLALPSC